MKTLTHIVTVLPTIEVNLAKFLDTEIVQYKFSYNN